MSRARRMRDITVCVRSLVCVCVCARSGGSTGDGESRRVEDARVGNRRRRARAMYVLAGHGGRGRRREHGGPFGLQRLNCGVVRGVVVADLGMVDARNSGIGSRCCAAGAGCRCCCAPGLRRCKMKMHDACTGKASGGSSCLSQARSKVQSRHRHGLPGWRLLLVPVGNGKNQSRWGVALLGEFGWSGDLHWLVEIRRRPPAHLPLAPVALAKPP